MNEFKDIMEERRLQNNFLWITKSFRPKYAFYRNSMDTNPLMFRYKVLIDDNINLLMQKAFPNGLQSDHFKRLNSMLQEIGYMKNIFVVRWLGLVLIKIMKKTVQSVFVAEQKLFQLRSNMGKHPIVFVPTHRSYADFILMAFLCFNYDIEIPVVVAGMDFYSMLGMATLLRQCGAVFMRRSFKEDKMYGAVFKKYVQTIIANGNSPFEFFIEGTRSRCGKSLVPKLGLLKMVTGIHQLNEVEDIIFVPIAISYDRLLEDILFAREVVGIPKPKESTAGLLKAISVLEELYGNIYINIGKEISLKNFKQQYSNEEDLLPRLSHMIVRSQQESTVITFFNVLCVVIISRLMLGNGNNLKITSLMEDITKLRQILISVGALISVFENIYDEIKRISNIHKFLILNRTNDTIFVPNINNDDKARKDVPQIVLTTILIQHYANPCYHFFVNPAIIISILRIKNTLDESILFRKFKLFRTLFKYEFLLFEYFDYQDFNYSCKYLQESDILRLSSDKKITLMDEKSIDYFWWCLLIPYIRGYLFICESLMRLIHGTFDISRLKVRIKKQLELELDVNDDVSLCYAFSSNFTSCTFSSLTDLEIIHSIGTDVIRITNLEKLKTITHFLKTLLKQEDTEYQDLTDFTSSKL